MTENELADRELWRTCVHEHGHAQVALALGYRCVIVKVWPNDDGNPDNSAWRGQIQYHENIPAGDMAIICLAGMVAEILLIDFPEDGYTFADAEQQAARIRACQTRRTGVGA